MKLTPGKKSPAYLVIQNPTSSQSKIPPSNRALKENDRNDGRMRQFNCNIGDLNTPLSYG